MPPELRIASPCSADWNLMKGDDRVRHCPECQLNVYNFSAMTKSEVDDLVRNRQGRLCARIYQRRDGKVLTQDCPVGFRARIKKISRIAGAALTAAMSLMPAFAQTNPSEPRKVAQTKPGKSAIKIHVIDPTGEVVSQANVSAVNQTTQEKFTGTTDANGNILLPHLPSASYAVSVEAPGFHTFTDTISAKHGTGKLDVVLRIGALTGA